ncbi:unnamed protein product [Diamesa serratosioi]
MKDTLEDINLNKITILLLLLLLLHLLMANRQMTVAINRAIEIVFLVEPDQTNFTDVMNDILVEFQLKYSDIEINFKHMYMDRSKSQVVRNEFCQLSVEGISLFIDITYTGYDFIKNTLQTHNIPHFSFDYSIQSFVKVMELFLKARLTTDVVFIFQNELETDESLYYFILKSTFRMIVLDQLTPNAVARLKKIRPTPSYYSIIADNANMERLFKIALDGDLITMPERWNLMFTDFEGDKFKYTNTFPEMSRLILDNKVCCNPICICSSGATLKNEALKSFLHQIVPIFEINGFPIQKFSCNSNSVTKSVVSETLIEDLFNLFDDNEMMFLEGYNIWYNLKFNVFTTPDNQTNVIEKTVIVDKDGVKAIGNNRVKASKRFFRIGIMPDSIPWSYFKKDPNTMELILNDNNGDKIWEGYCIDMLNKLSEKMVFTYEIVTNDKFGVRDSDGNFNGLTGDLVRGDTDIIIAPLKMTAEREEIMDFVAPYFEQTGILIVMKKPIADTSLFKFMTVLRLEVWLSIVGALSTTAIMIWLVDRYSPYSSRNHLYSYPCREFSFKESFWFALTSFTPQGGGEAPKALSGRILVAAYWLFVVLMLATFTANLAAFLTVERMQTPVQSLEQLARQSRINFTVVQGSDTHQYFKNMKIAEDKLYELWKQLTLSSSSEESQYRVWDYPVKEQFGQILMAIDAAIPVRNSSEGFTKVNMETNDFAFIHDSAEIRYEISRNCNLTAVGDIIAEQPYAIAVQQGSHLQVTNKFTFIFLQIYILCVLYFVRKDELSRIVLDLQKDRFFEYLSAKYWNTSIRGNCDRSDDSEGITLESLGGVFIATMVGLVLAMIILCVEIYNHRKKNAQEYEDSFKVPAIMPETLEHIGDSLDISFMKNNVLLGASQTFVPKTDKKRRLSYISVLPRSPMN